MNTKSSATLCNQSEQFTCSASPLRTWVDLQIQLGLPFIRQTARGIGSLLQLIQIPRSPFINLDFSAASPVLWTRPHQPDCPSLLILCPSLVQDIIYLMCTLAVDPSSFQYIFSQSDTRIVRRKPCILSANLLKRLCALVRCQLYQTFLTSSFHYSEFLSTSYDTQPTCCRQELNLPSVGCTARKCADVSIALYPTKQIHARPAWIVQDPVFHSSTVLTGNRDMYQDPEQFFHHVE